MSEIRTKGNIVRGPAVRPRVIVEKTMGSDPRQETKLPKKKKAKKPKESSLSGPVQPQETPEKAVPSEASPEAIAPEEGESLEESLHDM